MICRCDLILSSIGWKRAAKSRYAMIRRSHKKMWRCRFLSSLGWRTIRAEQKGVQFVSQPFASDIDHTGALSEAIVTLPTEVKPKDSIELEVGYEGVIPLDMTRLTHVGVPENIARHSSWDQIGWSFTAVRGAGYVAWYPITTESAGFF